LILSWQISPLSLTLVTIMLFFYRNIYAEVVTAIPVNGGNYNAVLNVSNKKSAAVVSCLSLLSYVATAIISAFSAILYLKILWDGLGLFTSFPSLTESLTISLSPLHSRSLSVRYSSRHDLHLDHLRCGDTLWCR
jgi:amino acid transporter